MVTFKDVKIDLQRQEKYRDYKKSRRMLHLPAPIANQRLFRAAV